MRPEASGPPVRRAIPFLRILLGSGRGWLLMAVPLMFVASGRNCIPIAAWIVPILMLRSLRNGTFQRFLAAYLASVLAWVFQFRGMVPVPPVMMLGLGLGYGFFAMVPFLADRGIAPHIRGMASTLVLPCAAASLDFLLAHSPYGSWGSMAYSQYGDLPLMQLVSVTGLYGITFLMAWTAAVANWAWERGFEPTHIRGGFLVWAGVLGGILLGGGIRLWHVPEGPTVRVASLSGPDVQVFPGRALMRRALAGHLSAQEIEAARARGWYLADDLLLHAAREADAGAKVIFWGETNAFCFSEDEPIFLARAAKVAREKGVYLGLAIGIWHDGEPHPLENALILMDPAGRVLWRYLKTRPVPGDESRMSRRGEGRLQFATTAWGRISGVICFDADFPSLLKQAGAGRADLLLLPSNDWKAIDPWHTQMAVFRAVEEGCNLVRQVSGGLSMAVDYRGCVLAAMDHVPMAENESLVSQVPIHGVTTFYSRIGDLFAWLTLAGLVSLAGSAWWLNRRDGGGPQWHSDPMDSRAPKPGGTGRKES